MTNPDNAGGLVWYVCTSCMLMVQLPSDTPTLGRCQCSPKGWSLRRAKLPSGYELCRAAPAGGVECFVREMRTSKGSEFFVVVKLGDRELTPHMYTERWKAEYDVASWQHLLCGAPEPDLLAYGPSEDSAPAGSGEVTDEMVEAAYSAWQDAVRADRSMGNREAIRDALEAALLRKLQQGADGWLSIESAPKDGTRFLAATDSGYQLILQWCCEGYFRDSRDKEWMPAKWQPLPPTSLIDWRDHYRQECAMRLMDGGVKTAAAAYEAADRNINTLERLAVNRAASQGQEGV